MLLDFHITYLICGILQIINKFIYIMGDLLLTCTNQKKQRARFFFHESGDPSSRFNIISPYVTDVNGELVYTPGQLDMRRKCEILKYKSNSIGEQNIQKNKYAYLSKKKKKTIENTKCNISLPTSSSDVPGTIINLYEDTSIPLYNYQKESKQFKFQNIPFDNFKRVFDSFPIFNISTPNQQLVSLMDLVILNPDNGRFTFNFSIPICIKFSADFVNLSSTYQISSAVLSIFSSSLDVFYSDSLISSVNVPFRTIPTAISSDISQSTQILSIDFANSEDGPVSCTQYVGNIIINGVDLITIMQYVYSLFLKLSTTFAEYSNDPNKELPIRTSVNGGNMNTTNEENLKNVKYSFITNFDNSDSVKENFSTSSNCSISIYNDVEASEASEIPYVPYEFTFAPS